MGTRLELQGKLKALGVKNVYFNPPASMKLEYPCIVYSLSDIRHNYADSDKYKNNALYSITLIDKNPDSSIVNDILKFQYCEMDRFYVSENLNHWVFSLYF